MRHNQWLSFPIKSNTRLPNVQNVFFSSANGPQVTCKGDITFLVVLDTLPGTYGHDLLELLLRRLINTHRLEMPGNLQFANSFWKGPACVGRGTAKDIACNRESVY